DQSHPCARAFDFARYNGVMKHLNAGAAKGKFFKVLHSTSDAQVAMMTLKPGQSTTDEPVNEHPRCEQWMFILCGTGRAITDKRRITLKTNSLLVIDKGEAHQITNTGKSPMATLNLYCPPAYTKSGDLRMMARVPTLLSALKIK